VPATVEALIEIVRVDVAWPPGEGVTEVGLKAPEAPTGNSEIDRLTAELKPLMEAMVMVEFPEPPCIIAKPDGEADKEKSGVGVDGGLMPL